jgi:hypothetical protein
LFAEEDLRRELQQNFAEVKAAKPAASRQDSAEIYFLARRALRAPLLLPSRPAAAVAAAGPPAAVSVTGSELPPPPGKIRARAKASPDAPTSTAKTGAAAAPRTTAAGSGQKTAAVAARKPARRRNIGSAATREP